MAAPTQQLDSAEVPPSDENHRSNADQSKNTPLPPPTNAAAMASAGTARSTKKTKAKKGVDPNETGKLLAAKINQLELDAAGEKDQEQEIAQAKMLSLEHLEREVRKATRDLNNLLAGMGTPLEKMDALHKKNSDLFQDMKRLERDYAKSKKRADQMQKERDAQRTELNKTVTVKDKLEKLAREFTKDNKKLKDDIRRLEETEKRSRESMSEKHELLFMDLDRIISKKHGDDSELINMRLEDQFRQKFKTFFDQYNLRELHLMSLLRTKETEIQHLLTRLEAQRKMSDSESARSRQLSAQVSTFSQTETELRSQLNIYVEKFKQVEDTLNNSNDLFLTFRKEMEDMSKKTKRLEKENLSLTRKHDSTNRNILEMAEERTKANNEIDSLRKKNTTLESVIRRMQDQGRGPALSNGVDVDDGTESEYGSEEEDEEYEVNSEEAEYDDDTEEDLNMQAGLAGSGPFASIPPPPPPSEPGLANGHFHGEARNQQRVVEL